MKRILLIVLSIAAAGTLTIAQAQEDSNPVDCDNCVTVDEICHCGGTVDGCTGNCDECDCDSDSEECTDCEDCTGCDSDCDDCTSEEVQHCGGCH